MIAKAECDRRLPPALAVFSASPFASQDNHQIRCRWPGPEYLSQLGRECALRLRSRACFAVNGFLSLVELQARSGSSGNGNEWSAATSRAVKSEARCAKYAAALPTLSIARLLTNHLVCRRLQSRT